MKKHIEKIKKIFDFKNKSPYYIANIILISLLSIIGVVYAVTAVKENFIKDPVDKYYADDSFAATSTLFGNETNLATTTPTTTSVEPIIRKKGLYVEIINSCNNSFGGGCVRARSCPSKSCPTIANLRNGMVLRTDGEITHADGVDWYHVFFDEWVRYPDRTAKDWYISADYINVVENYKERFAKGVKVENKTNKEIIVNLTKQKLYAYEGDELYMQVTISSGLEDLPTPRGVFHIYEKTPSRYMQGPLPGVSDQEYDLPGVPWTMYFTYGGAAIHGAYWHDNFGSRWSHGCVNLRPLDSEKLYNWTDLGTKVTVRD